MQAALDRHYEEYPQSRPSLADLAVATAELDGHPLANKPDHIAPPDNAGSLPTRDATVNAELRCFVEVQAPDPCTKLTRCTELPR
jgi:hypothetical protein